ncbi:hypothetical protein PAMC26510_24655 [Caballeronia sordidicola]|uniref:Uncharacterized protein n=1 Tax=Caballeronia sordidicola TaxID=196367 RepID=A0A242MJA3_CABSO|nr:hypothetical protein PAMC26510_24655 [Caballeronia sordidicola]
MRAIAIDYQSHCSKYILLFIAVSYIFGCGKQSGNPQPGQRGGLRR